MINLTPHHTQQPHQRASPYKALPTTLSSSQVSPELDEMDNLAEYKQWAELKYKELSQALKLGATNLEPTSHVRHENALFCPISEQCKVPPSLSK